MTLLDHAESELAIAARSGDEDLATDPAIAAAMLDIIRGFAAQGHSGGSAAYVGPRVAQVIGQLLAYEPITPLTGGDDEWMTVSEDVMGRPGMEMNVRCGRVWRVDGVCYDQDAVIFRTRRYGAINGWDSARRVTFPYTPTTRYTRWRRVDRLIARLRGQLRPS